MGNHLGKSKSENKSSKTYNSNSEKGNLILEELRRKYDYELSRKRTLESKASALFGLGAVAGTILIYSLPNLLTSPNLSIAEGLNFLNLTNNQIVFSLKILIITSAMSILISMFYLFRVLNIEFYKDPYPVSNGHENNGKNNIKNFDYNYQINIRKIEKKSEKKIRECLKCEYESSHIQNYCINDKKNKIT